ncbi:hypothetical protein PG988_016056 [Apiospora saccharicola]
MLTSRLLRLAVIRRWVRHSAETHGGDNSAIVPVVEVCTKSGALGAHYASYFGLALDFDVDLAILAHDGDTNHTSVLDLNVYADIVSEAFWQLQAGYRGGRNGSALQWDLSRRWELRVPPSEATGSDHRTIETVLEMATPAAEGQERLLFKNAPWKESNAWIAAALATTPTGGTVQE